MQVVCTYFAQQTSEINVTSRVQPLVQICTKITKPKWYSEIWPVGAYPLHPPPSSVYIFIRLSNVLAGCNKV